MNKRGLHEQARQRARDRRRALSGENRERMMRRAAAKAGLTMEQYLSARVARESGRAERIARRRDPVNMVDASLAMTRERRFLMEAQRLRNRSAILARYHQDPDNWSTRRKRRDLFERDGWKCRICGRFVTDRVKHGTSNRAVAGHVLAKATGGEWTPENMATLCHPCNVADGVNRVPIQTALALS